MMNWNFWLIILITAFIIVFYYSKPLNIVYLYSYYRDVLFYEFNYDIFGILLLSHTFMPYMLLS
jgi:hypothetical protein